MKYTKHLLLGGIFATFLGIFLYKQNNDIEVSTHEFYHEKIPKGFDNYKILQISDLHSKNFGRHNKKLLDIIDALSPNIIVVTGDIYYSYKDKIKHSLALLKKLAKKYPVYFVTGNHEQRDKNWKMHKLNLKTYGVNIIDEKTVRLKFNSAQIQLAGLKDPSFYHYQHRYKIFPKKIKTLYVKLDKNLFNVLLSHRPDKMEHYAQSGFDLVLSGHAHGGQIRLFNKGLIAPSEGFFPKFTSGLYKQNQTSMIVSRGLGRTIFFTRLFNKPELILVKLKNCK